MTFKKTKAIIKKIFHISLLLFNNTLNATSDCEISIEEHENAVVHQSFCEYKAEREGKSLKLLFPGGRELYSPTDKRGEQQKHKGFYTIDQDSQQIINPHLKGNIFSESLWNEIEDGSIDLTHIEIPGAIFLYDCTCTGRDEKDDFLLRKVSQKSKNGGKLFIDLRYSRFWPQPNLNTPQTLEEIKNSIKELAEKDPDFFISFSYNHNDDHLISFWHALLGENEEEIRDIIEKNAQPSVYIKDAQAFNDLRERADLKQETMTPEEWCSYAWPYIIFFHKDVRDHIFEQYDSFLGRYGFERFCPIIELYGKFNNNILLEPPFQQVDGKVLYKGMCFLDTISEYTKVRNIETP